MPGKSFNPADAGYVEVKDRIEAFYAKFPNGAIRTDIYSLTEDQVIVGAEAYADRCDERPMGTGFSAMKIPGSTPYTKDSELENAETSAVGRAIANAGFEVHRSVASADEVAFKTDSSLSAKIDNLKQNVRAAGEDLFGAHWRTKVKNRTGLTLTNKDSEADLERALDILEKIDGETDSEGA